MRVREPAGGETIDEALALWFPAPNSETGEDKAELQLHGGRAVVAAVLAAFASTQLAAATLAAAQQLSAGAPVRGSRMWCTRWPPLLHAREPVLDVARPPSRRATTG